MLWLCIELSFCRFGHTRNTSVMYKKEKFVSFINTQSPKMKFESVQINMKQVSYNQLIFHDQIYSLQIIFLLTGAFIREILYQPINQRPWYK